MTDARRYRIARIAGDGIGREVVPAAWRLLETLASRHGFVLEGDDLPWGCDRYRRTGRMMPDDALDRLQGYDAIFLGAVGAPDVPEHEPVWGLVLPIRQQFDQYVNLRPMRLLPGLRSPLAGRGPADIDMVCVRENSEGEYSGLGRRTARGSPADAAEQTARFTRRGVERIVRFAFETARSRPRKLLASVTKSNALQHSMRLWDEVVEELAPEFGDIDVRSYHIDALAARMVTAPESLDTIVASNLFGDILSDLGAAVSGSLGIAPSANLNPTRTYPSMFEPIHGAAPDIAGRGIANPIGAIMAGGMMLRHLGETDAHDDLVAAVESTLREGRVRTPDLGGSASTESMATAIIRQLRAAE